MGGRQERWTPSGVRLRRIAAGPGRGNRLFVPGGPGLGSESVAGLAEAAPLPQVAADLAARLDEERPEASDRLRWSS